MLGSFYVEETLNPGSWSRLRLGRRWTRAAGTQRPIFRTKKAQVEGPGFFRAEKDLNPGSRSPRPEGHVGIKSCRSE